jgi:solute carrier organic anion transporter family, member 4A
VNGFVSVVISTIEKRFNLSSRQSGFIASGYDIASVLCLIPISYFGGIGHKPRWIAGGIILLSLGSFLFAMPHFIVDKYTYGELKSDSQAICVESAATSGNLSSVVENDSTVAQSQIPLERGVSSLDRYMFILVLAQMLHGAGATPIYTLAVTYLDDSLKTKVAPLYLGMSFYLLLWILLLYIRSRFERHKMLAYT